VSFVGKARRLGRLLSPVSGRGVFLPIDQPFTLGPLPGVADMRRDLPLLLAGAPDAVIAHRGLISKGLLGGCSSAIVLHLSAATALSGRADVKTLLTGVEDALHLGVDAVSVHISFGIAEETPMLAAAGLVAASCDDWGVPLLVMAYVVGSPPDREPEKLAHAARVAAELGADIVKIPYTGSAESFADVVSSCFVPVLMAGGTKAPWEDVLTDVRDAISAGARGACIGRNVFQRADPIAALADLRVAVHDEPAKVFAHAQ
jgi:predicted phospho-2-dehydro-3-deoxyheptonate aldolase